MALNYFERIREKENVLVYADIYDTIRTAKTQFTDILNQGLAAAQSEEGIFTTADGRTIDMNKPSGMTVFSQWLNQLNADLTFVEGTFSAVKKLEERLQNITAS